MNTILSVGFNNFHLLFLGAELERYSFLKYLITGAYPQQKRLKFINLAKYHQFRQRRENISDMHIIQNTILEIPWFLYGQNNLNGYIALKCLEKYQNRAAHFIKKTNIEKNSIYHFRSGYGGHSIECAISKGLTVISDHTMAHPLIDEFLVLNCGKLPSKKDLSSLKSLPKFLQTIADDLRRDIDIIVNSDFVKFTMEIVGFNPEKIHVAYLGVEDKFLKLIEDKASNQFSNSKQQILFAGAISERKGIEELIQGFKLLDNKNVILNIAGPIKTNKQEILDLLKKTENVKYHGNLLKKDLAKLMLQSSIFIFPSYCEGSARVIFEAMAAGCYIITTKNSGSIVQDDSHGKIISPGSELSVMQSLQYSLKNLDLVKKIGNSNAELIKNEYKQSAYGKRVTEIYKSLLQ